MKRDRNLVTMNRTLLAAVCITAVAVSAEGAGREAGTLDAQRAGTAEKRDPFWPVGYMPKQTFRSVSQQGSPKVTPLNSWNEAMKKVVINGVSSRTDNEFFAVINGDVKRVGDTVSVRLGSSVYTWAVDGIESPGSVKLRRLSVRQG